MNQEEQLQKDVQQLRQTLDEKDIEIDRLRQKIASRDESTRIYNSLIEGVGDVVVQVSLDGRITHLSSNIFQFGGYNAEEEIGEHFSKYMAIEEEQYKLLDLFKTVIESCEYASPEFLYLPKKGSPFFVEVTGCPVQDESTGKVTAVQCILRNISERKQIEQALIESEQRFKSIFENQGEGVALVDLDEMFTAANPAAHQIFGLPTGQLVGRKLTDFVDAANAEKILNQTRLRKTGAQSIYEVTIIRPDGEARHLWVTSTPDVNSEGVLIGSYGIFRDITERKKAEAELNEIKHLLEAAIAQSPSGILIADAPDVTIRMANPAAFGIRGGEQKLLLNIDVEKHALQWQTYQKDGKTLYLPEELPLSRAVLQGETVINEEVIIRDEAGNDHWVTVNAAPILNAKNEVTSGIVVFHDISDRKALESEREAMIANLEAKNAEMERFIYTVSHDLKSPMITIQGFCGLIRQDLQAQKPEQISMYLDRITESSDQMYHLLNGLLELSRIGRVVHANTRCSMNQLVEKSVNMLEKTIQEAGVRVTIQDNMPHVLVDEIRIQEVWINLIENAVKYSRHTDKPLIQIGCECRGKETVFFIRDNGIGVKPDYHQEIFGLFNQLNPGQEGTGVGLSIVKRIIEFHGGRIWVDSEGKNRGSVFCFTLKA